MTVDINTLIKSPSSIVLRRAYIKEEILLMVYLKAIGSIFLKTLNLMEK